MGSRQRPLQTCWISLLEISSKAYTTTSRNFNDGNSAVDFPSLSVICALQSHILAILTFLDDWFLRIESLAEAIFPPLKQFFNRIDELVKSAESLPEKLDDTINKIPALVRQVPFLEWGLVHFISWLGFLITLMTHWGIMGVKEISVAAVDNRRNDGLLGKRKKKKKKTRKMDVQIVTGKEGSNPDDEREEAVTAGEKLGSNDSEIVEGKSENIAPHIDDVQTVMMDGLMVQQEVDHLTIMTGGNEAMTVHDSDEKKNDDSRGVAEKCTDIDPNVVEEMIENAPTNNKEPVRIVPQDISDQTFEADGSRITQEMGHQTEKVDYVSVENNDNIHKCLNNNDPKTTEGIEEERILTDNEQQKTITEGRTFTSNGSMTENADDDHQTLQIISNEANIIQRNNENDDDVRGIDQQSTSDDQKAFEGTAEQHELTSNGIATRQDDDDMIPSSNDLRIKEDQAADNQMFHWNESEIDPSVTSNGSALVSETDETTIDSDCSQIKSDHRYIFAPFSKELETSMPKIPKPNSVTSNGSALVSETDETTMDSDCSQIKWERRYIFAPNFSKEVETSMPRIPKPSWSNVIKGSYKDVLEKGKTDQSIQEIQKYKEWRQDHKARRQGKKVARGTSTTQEESREGKARRKGKRKKAELMHFSTIQQGIIKNRGFNFSE